MPDQIDVEPDQHSELSATRHLCAGVYLDRSFRDLVIRKVHNDSRRRVAPSYGFDLVPVVRHAWRAWVLEVVLHSAALAVLTAGVALHHTLAIVIVVCAFALYVLLHDAGRHLVALARIRAAETSTRWSSRPNARRRSKDIDEMNRRVRRLKAALAGCVLLALTPVVAANSLGMSLRAELTPAAVLVGTLLLCGLVIGVLRQFQLNANHRAKSLRPEKLTRREQTIDEQQDHPCVVYQRPEHDKDIDPLDLLLTSEQSPSPFVGSGKLVNRWLPPMTIQLLRPDPVNLQGLAQREHITPPFHTHDLVDRLKAALEQLTTDSDSENLPGLRVRNRLYVAESDVSADRKLLHGNVDFAMRRVMDNPQTLAHHFLETSAPIAGGELVTSVLIRVSLKGRCLSLDVATCALTRTPQAFHVIDRYAEHGFSAVVRAAIRAVFTLPRDVFHMWRLLEIPAVLARAWWAVKDRTLQPRRGVQVGARIAIREAVADDWKNAHLDETSIYDHMKIIEQRILKATEDFLQAHDVDTSAFEKQATNIVNSGVLNMGGVTEINQSAVGASAKVLLGAAEDLQAATKEQSA